MTVIMKHHWTVLVRCSIMVPVSSIFLQENRFSPLNSGLFFCSTGVSPLFLAKALPQGRGVPRIFHSAE
jgi:hypothetical protein